MVKYHCLGGWVEFKVGHTSKTYPKTTVKTSFHDGDTHHIYAVHTSQ